MDEPEALGAIGLAAREELDNLTFVINCNLQRLDGPVRGNGKIIQQLESFFRGAGWNVIKVIWGREWDPLLAADSDGALVNLMNVTPDGDYQTYKAESGAYVREHFFGRDQRTRRRRTRTCRRTTTRAPTTTRSSTCRSGAGPSAGTCRPGGPRSPRWRCRPAPPTPTSSAAPASRRWPARWPSSGCSKT